MLASGDLYLRKSGENQLRKIGDFKFAIYRQPFKFMQKADDFMHMHDPQGVALGNVHCPCLCRKAGLSGTNKSTHTKHYRTF